MPRGIRPSSPHGDPDLPQTRGKSHVARPRIVRPIDITVSTRPSTGGISSGNARGGFVAKTAILTVIRARNVYATSFPDGIQYTGILPNDEKRPERKKRHLDTPIYTGVFGSSLEPRALFHRLGAISTLVGIFRIFLASAKKLSAFRPQWVGYTPMLVCQMEWCDDGPNMYNGKKLEFAHRCVFDTVD